MTGIKAIETVYRGIRYRSRIEARWAVAYTKLDVPFEYEKEGFDLGSAGYYLPDFWMPQQKCWIEIKGQKPTKEEEERCAALASASGYPVILFPCTIPEIEDEANLRCPSDGCDGAYLFRPDGGWDNYYRWCVCMTCGAMGIEFDGRSDRLPCKRCYHCDHVARGVNYPAMNDGKCPVHGDKPNQGCPLSRHGDKGYTPGHQKIARAFDAARSARFEHGESGEPKQGIGGIPRLLGATIQWPPDAEDPF